MANLIYRNTLVYVNVSILASQSQSNIVSCINLPANTESPEGIIQAAGSASLRRINIPSSWDPGNITFQVSETDNSPDFNDLYITDGTNVGILSLNGSVQNSKIVVQPWWFDSVNYFRMIFSNPPSSDSTIQLVMASIYQGDA